mgnify:CR=1 FL=1
MEFVVEIQTPDCYLNSNDFVVVAAVEVVNDDVVLENHGLMKLVAAVAVVVVVVVAVEQNYLWEVWISHQQMIYCYLI